MTYIVGRNLTRRTLRAYAQLAIVFVLLLIASMQTSFIRDVHAQAVQDFTVNSTDDKVDGDCDEEHCSLREAITAANEDSTTKDNILFGIEGAIPHRILPLSPLPDISDPAVINGYSQSDSVVNTLRNGNNAVVAIVLDGTFAGQQADGIRITGGNTTVKGLVIQNFSEHGIVIEGGSGSTVTGNFLGTNFEGEEAKGNGNGGVRIQNSSGNTVGGFDDGERNLISGNHRNGIRIQGSTASGNKVYGNFIGTDRHGTTAIANSTLQKPGSGAYIAAVAIQDAPGNFVGGDDGDDGTLDGDVRARNIVSGNIGAGITIFDSNAKDNLIQGNYVGTDVTGTKPLGNQIIGVGISEPVGSPGNVASDNTIGGGTPGARNIISGNGFHGVQILHGASNNFVLGNFIGTTANGSVAMGNRGQGVSIFKSPSNFVGSADHDIESCNRACNLISASEAEGVSINGNASTGNKVQGNFIGTDLTGQVSDPDGTPESGDEFGNKRGGVRIDGSPANLIGGIVPDEGNLISGNLDSGVLILGTEASGNEIYGNYIGTTPAGFTALSNLTNGVTIVDASSNKIGSPKDQGLNIISANGLNGIQLFGPTASDNTIQNNLIGVALDGIADLGNTEHGILINNGADDNQIGGLFSGEENIIAFNGASVPGRTKGSGIAIAFGSQKNSIRRNSIFENALLGIDLNINGFTPNDDDDTDLGANGLQNSPVVHVDVKNTSTILEGTLTSTPNEFFQLEFFSSDKPSTYGVRQGKTFLGFANVDTDDAGIAHFELSVAGTHPDVTATAMDKFGNTSEFSRKTLIHSVEFTQAIQEIQSIKKLKDKLESTGNTPVPIVAKKPAYMRVYPVQNFEAASMSVEASGVTFKAPTQLASLNATCSPDDRRRRTVIGLVNCQSVDFSFIPPVGEWTVTIVIRDNLGRVVESHDFSFDTKETDGLVLKEVSICGVLPFGAAQCSAPGSLNTLIPLLRSVAPTDDVRVVPTGHQVKLPIVAGDVNGDGDFDDCYLSPFGCEKDFWWNTIVDNVDELYTLLDKFTADAAGEQYYYYGIIKAGLATTQGGQAHDIPGRGAASQTSVMRHSGTVETNDEVMAHETGHMLNAQHTNTRVPSTASAPGCYSRATDSSTDWPFADNTIQSNPASPTPEVGLDVMTNAIKLPAVHFEMMSYCTPRWISPINYLKILATLDSPAPLPQGDPGIFWLISGTTAETGETDFRPLYELETLGLDVAGEGTHRIEVRDATDAVLFTRFFTPTSSSPETEGEHRESTPFFTELVPVQAAAASIVVLNSANVELSSLAMGGVVPVVTFVSPAGGENWNGANVVEWSVSDADSTDHTYRVQYSNDGGTTWQSIGSGIVDSSIAVDFDILGGSSGASLLRVFASDGTNSGTAISNAFSVGTKLPLADIFFPNDATESELGDMVWLQGFGLDLDDGEMDEAGWEWQSSLDGLLGTGDDLPTAFLSIGDHLITLTVTDSDGNESSDSINVSIVETPMIEGVLPAIISFDETAIEVNEDDGEAIVSLSRSGNAQGAISIDFALVEGTATEGEDYEGQARSLTFADGVLVETFSIPIVNDARPEDVIETLQVVISGLTASAVLEGPASIEVRITDDETDGAETFVVTNTDNSGAGSFRQAITDANSKSGFDFIEFNIPGSGVQSIRPTTRLPTVTGQVMIDGYSQPGSSQNTLQTGSDAVLLIELNGSDVSSGNGLNLAAGDSVIQGLVINNFDPRFTTSPTNLYVTSRGGNVIRGNFIGTDASGTVAMGTDFGIRISNTTDNLVGGNQPQDRNLISGNGAGIALVVTSIDLTLNCRDGIPREKHSTCNVIKGNYIGTTAEGTGPLGNLNGVTISGASNNEIGGILPGQGNVIAFNRSDGVRASEISKILPNQFNIRQYRGGRSNTIRGNSIFSNNQNYVAAGRKLGSGINLFIQGNDSFNSPSRPIVVNDALDNDDGPNRLQNYPELRRAESSGGVVTIDGRLESRRSRLYEVDFYSNDALDLSGFGEGKNYIGSTTVDTNAIGPAEFSASFSVAIADGRFITATATDEHGNTSEFSARVRVGVLINEDTFVVNTTDDLDDGICDVSHCSLREAIHTSNSHFGMDNIHFDIPGIGVHTISFSHNLPPIMDPVIIDGFTQPGSSANTVPEGSNAVLGIELKGSGDAATGLNLASGDSTIRGLVINGSPLGIFVQRAGGNSIEGNFIGLNSSGTSIPTGSRFTGIQLVSSSNNTIGGILPRQRNVTGNIQLTAGRTNAGFQSGSDNNTVQGNYVGTTNSGNSKPANIQGIGIRIEGSSGNLIGGTTQAKRNIVSGTVSISGSATFIPFGLSRVGALNNKLFGNNIGLAVNNISPLGGTVALGAGANNNVIGGIAPGQGNAIAYSSRAGVTVGDKTTIPPKKAAIQNSIRGNSIFKNNHASSNTGLGIDIAGTTYRSFNGHPTVNDNGDQDGKGNNSQNFPVLESAINSSGEIVLSGRLRSHPQRSYQVDFYSNLQMDTSGYGEGETYIGSTSATTDADGIAEFNVTLPVDVLNGRFITATATDGSNNTSEFSARLEVGDILADTFIVNSTNDVDDGICDQTHCSLREAIHGANNHRGSDLIAFDIPGDGVRIIRPIKLNLPPITDPVTIDGYTQPGASANTLSEGSDAQLLIELDGTGLKGTVGTFVGLHVRSGGSTIRGLIISKFPTSEGIMLQENDGNVIEGNYIATDSSGTQRAAGARVNIFASSGNLIGGATPAARNVIAAIVQITGRCGQHDDPEVVFYHTASNVLQGNYIGTDKHGTAALGAGGVLIACSTDNTIGGGNPGERNVISVAGTVSLMGNDGVPGNNRLIGNYVGTDLTGTKALGGGGVIISGTNNIVGGSQPGEGNLISGNFRGISIQTSEFSNANLPLGSHIIQGNLIGTDKDGRLALGNRDEGIRIASSNNVIGGPNPGEGNVISGNGGDGVFFRPIGFVRSRGDYPTQENLVQGNFIGTQADGVSPMGNVGHGISILGKAIDNVIGGTAPGEGNVIAYNGLDGISTNLKIFPSEPNRSGRINRNEILSNSIHSNFGIGIDLADDGVSENDLNDIDAGPNNLQNFPDIVSFSSANGSTAIEGSLNSRPNEQHRLEFFDNIAFDSSHFGEGDSFIGAADVTTDSSGDASFNISFPYSLPGGHIITSTATDSQGNSSEFSGKRPEEAAGLTADLSVTKTANPESGSQAQPLTYTITVHNDGPDDATNVMVLDTLPPNVALDTTALRDVGCGSAGNVFVFCDLGGIAAGATAAIEFVAIPSRLGLITNSVSVSGNQFDPDTTNNTATVDTQIISGSDVSVTKTTTAPERIGVNSSIITTLTVLNSGPSTATNVTLVDTLDPSMAFSFFSGSTPCVQENGLINCSFGNLTPGVIKIINYSVTYTEVGLITNRVELATDSLDPNLDNNVATLEIEVLLSANLVISKSASPSPARINEELTYTLEVSNLGPMDAIGVSVVDNLPPEVSFVRAEPEQGDCQEDAGTVTCDIGDMTNGTTSILKIVVVPQVEEGFITNSAVVSSSGSFDSPADSDDSVEIVVSASECSASLYGAAFSSRGEATLYAIDPSTGSATLIGPIGFDAVSGMDFDPDTGLLYATAKRSNFGPHVLLEIDPCTGRGVEIGLTNVEDIDSNNTATDLSFTNSDSLLYGFLMSREDLATLDVSTGIATKVGTISPAGQGGNGIALSPDDVLFHANDVNLSTINQATGAPTAIAPLIFPPTMTSNPRLNALDFDPETGVLFGSLVNGFNGERHLATLDTSTGQLSLIGQTIDGLDALAFFMPPASPGDVNRPPVLAAIADLELNEGDTLEVAISATDPDGDPVEFIVTTLPIHGVLSDGATIATSTPFVLSGDIITYTPETGYNGPDEFTLKANDGALDSNTAAISIDVLPVNVAPTADDQAVNTDENTSLLITLAGDDADDDDLDFIIVTLPTHGVLSDEATAATSTPFVLSGDSLTYTPDADYNGRDGFLFKTNDGSEDSNHASVSIDVLSVNVLPAADAGGPYSGEEGSPIALDGSRSTDPDGSIITYDWDLNNDGEFDDATGVTLERTFDSPGTFIIGLKVTDDDGESDTDTSEVVVYQPSPTGDVDLSITKTADVKIAALGDQVTYTIIVTNNGTGSATNVIVEDHIPFGLSIDSVTADCEVAGETVVCELSSLEGGKSAELAIIGTVGLHEAVIDFEDLPEGSIVDSVALGRGIVDEDISGEVSVFGDSRRSISSNAAIIFDATCDGGCSGGENDLFAPELGNVLIMAKDIVDEDGDGLVDDPDGDSRPDAPFTFDFRELGLGKVTVISMDVLDVEERNTTGDVDLFFDGDRLANLNVPVVGDNGRGTMPIGVAGVDKMSVTLSGSGAIDNIVLLVADTFIRNRVVVSFNDEDVDPANNEASVITEVVLELMAPPEPPTPTPEFDLLFSLSPDRSGSVSLEGKTVSGDIFVFTDTDESVDQVRFYLDGAFFDDENVAPHDLVGAGVPFDTTTMDNGTHSITAEIDFDGETFVVIAEFLVDNAVEPPTSASEFDVLFSLSSDRSGAVSLNSETVLGDIFVFTNTDEEVDQVRFFIDGEFYDDENVAPHDLVGGGVPFDTTGLDNGPHSMTAEIDFDGDTFVVTAVFEVDNVAEPLPPDLDDFGVLLSLSSDRSDAMPLEGETVSGQIFVFTSPNEEVKKVIFAIDGVHVRTESRAPFDFAGTTPDTTASQGLERPAKAFDTFDLTNGTHVVTVEIDRTGTDDDVLIVAEFTVIKP